jgi:hypothetical protein
MTEPQRLVQNGFGSIEIEKGKLLDIIKENKEKHIEEFNKSVKAYEVAKLAYAQEFWAQLSENIGLTKSKMEDKLEMVADAVLKAREIHTSGKGSIDLKDVNAALVMNIYPKVQMTVKQPVSHEKEYTVAIRGLELSTAEFVFLNQGDFSRYVLDEWDWKAEFSLNNSITLSGTTMTGHSHFNNTGISVLSSGCFALGETSSPYSTIDTNNIYGSVISGCSTLGVKSAQLYSSIYNNTPEVK